MHQFAGNTGDRGTSLWALLLSLALALAGAAAALGLSSPPAAAQTAVAFDGNGVASEITLKPSTDSGTTLEASYTIKVKEGAKEFSDLVLAVRDAGSNYDFIHRQNITVGHSEPETFSDTRSLPHGSYRAHVAYRTAGGEWVDMGPPKTFTVGPVPTPPPGRGWKLAFSDEFNDGTFNTTKWSTRYERPGVAAYTNWNNGEAQWYKPGNVTESGGTLNLTAKREKTRYRRPDGTYKTFKYSSGMVTSRPSLNFRYGFIQARVKLPKGSGFWPAFWTWPSDHRFSTPEIDMMEFWGDNPNLLYQIYHRQLPPKDTRKVSTATKLRAKDWTAKWHTVGAKWEPARPGQTKGTISWYVDDMTKPRMVQRDNATRAAHLVANLAVSNGRMGPVPNAQTRFPSSFRVNYIRVWQR